MISAPKDGARFCISWIAVLFLTSALNADEGCAVEVKLLLSPTATQAAIASLKLEKETTGQVYFFDTSNLDLLSKGVMVRLRQGSDNDLTVKVRPLEGTKFVDPSEGREDFKCEVDMTGGKTNHSYSIRSKSATPHVPEGGEAISSLLTVSQKSLLKAAHVSIGWSQVKRIATIKSTDWETKTQSPFAKLTLELWEWPAGSILELSTKVGPDAGPSAYAELQRLVNSKKLSQNTSQRSKTSMVLEALRNGTAQ